MRITAIIKSITIYIFIVLVFCINPYKAKALGYSADMEFDITLIEDLSANINQKVLITNNSKEFLSSSLSLDFPFLSVGSLQVESEGELLPASVENGRLWVEFPGDSLDFGEEKIINIKYQIPAFVEDLGSIKGFVLPKFVVENKEASYPVRINYPIQWDDIRYSSQGVDMNYAFETRRAVVFNLVNRPLSVYVGNYSLKQADLSVMESTGGLDRQELFIPLKNKNYFIGDESFTKREIVDGQTKARVNLKEYDKNKAMMMISKSENIFPDTQNLGSYDRGVEDFPGIDTDSPVKLYQIVLSRLNPSRSIIEWSRDSVTETLGKLSHSDLDYANTLSAVFRSKNIPVHIVYGLARYPDGKFYWHFWNVFQERDGQKLVWREVDPYLEDLTGDQYFQNLPPTRIIWGVLETESDLSDLGTDLFYIKLERLNFKYYPSSSVQAGYITSQLNRKTITPSIDSTNSVLGLESSRLSDGGLGYNGSAFVSVLSGFTLISFARYFYYTEKKYKVKLKTK